MNAIGEENKKVIDNEGKQEIFVICLIVLLAASCCYCIAAGGRKVGF
jgi:hypothetical protein